MFHYKTGIYAIWLLGLLWLPIPIAGQTNTTSFPESHTGFIENKGQIINQNYQPNPDVLYLLNTPGFNVQLRKGGWSYDIYTSESSGGDDTYPFPGKEGDSVLNSQFSILNCGDSLTDIRDNQKYPTIQIGAQCWMAANLNYGTMIPVTTPQRDNCFSEKYCYANDLAFCNLHFAFYQWDELMTYTDSEEAQGLCPPGWHVPSEADWNQLFAVYQGNAFAGSPLLFTGYSGFNALLSGAGLYNQRWSFPGFATLFWSSTSHGAYKAWAHGLNEYNYSVSFYPAYRANAFSVSCLRDN